VRFELRPGGGGEMRVRARRGRARATTAWSSWLASCCTHLRPNRTGPPRSRRGTPLRELPPVRLACAACSGGIRRVEDGARVAGAGERGVRARCANPSATLQ